MRFDPIRMVGGALGSQQQGRDRRQTPKDTRNDCASLMIVRLAPPT
jgi:hypothetical protein